jgi:hypothetical protein
MDRHPFRKEAQRIGWARLDAGGHAECRGRGDEFTAIGHNGREGLGCEIAIHLRGASRDVRRPDVVPGVNPFLEGTDKLLYLNPAAFSIPAPGTNGNFERNSIKGPGFKQTDFVATKRVPMRGTSNFEFRIEVFNLFNTTNFANPSGKLANALPDGARRSPTKSSRGSLHGRRSGRRFGAIRSTVARTVGLGTNRQIQLGIRMNF